MSIAVDGKFSPPISDLPLQCNLQTEVINCRLLGRRIAF